MTDSYLDSKGQHIIYVSDISLIQKKKSVDKTLANKNR